MKRNSAKAIFSVAYYLLALATLCYGALAISAGDKMPGIALVIISAVPLLQKLGNFDRWVVPHHKVKLPLVSLCVFLSLAFMLVSQNQQSDILLVAFANLGGFLLNTYWAESSYS